MATSYLAAAFALQSWLAGNDELRPRQYDAGLSREQLFEQDLIGMMASLG